MLSDERTVPDSVARIERIEDCRPELQDLHRLWLRLRGERSMPSRRDFRPAEARHLLRHLILIDVDPDAPRKRRFRVRLHGTAQVEYQGVDWTGAHPHDKASQAAADRFCDIGDHIVATKQPLMSTGSLFWMPEKPYSRFEAILMPMSDDGDRVNMILGLTIFF